MRFIQIFLVVLLLISIIFLGGAYLIPDKQYFSETRTFDTDPVAVFSYLNNPEMLNQIASQVIDENEIKFELTGMKEFEHINYRIHADKLKDPLVAGFVLTSDPEGTQLTGYFELDSLDFPLGRWKGYFIPVLYKNSFTKGIDMIEDNITR